MLTPPGGGGAKGTPGIGGGNGIYQKRYILNMLTFPGGEGTAKGGGGGGGTAAA